MSTASLSSLPSMKQLATSQIIAEHVRELIATGALSQGAPLSEVALAKALGVSRGPVREALQRLVQEGLLESEKNRRLRVPRLSPVEIKDIYCAREAIEAAGLSAIIDDPDPRFFLEAENVLDRMQYFVDYENASEATEADLAFHLLIIGYSKSPRLKRAFATLLIETRMCMSELLTLDPTQGESVELHRAILRAVESGSAERAREALRAHNNVVLKNFV